MKNPQNYLDIVGNITQELNRLGFQPVLVGGMALVILGSQRVTKDFDFVISKQHHALENLVTLFYQYGLELASKLDKQGNIIVTIDNPKVAYLRLKIDSPNSAYFLNPQTGLRMDLLFDFPISAKELAEAAKKIKISSNNFLMASKKDLIRLKKIAKKQRSKSGDQDDLDFLEGL